MKILPSWLREFVDVPADDRQLADDLTNSGSAVEGVEIVNGEAVFEVEFTANRVDTMNHYGLARECAAVYDRDLELLAAGEAAGTPASRGISIEIETTELCARYTGQVVRNVTVKSSPDWVTARLALLEARAINNVTDASNYTLLEMGHPTHCFDLDKLEGGKIVVRRARPGEKLRTLDGVERTLHPEDLVIADAAKPVALAGVMGGFDTMITESTRNVLIEAAWFEPAAIRKTARRHGMHTDASHRFERGADIEATTVACARVAQRARDWAGGELEGGQIDVYPRPLQRVPVVLRRAQIARILGGEVSEQHISRILRRLGFVVTPGRSASVPATTAKTLPAGSGGAGAAIAEQAADFLIVPPSWRLDVEREIDLIEEVARIYGYDRFPSALPAFSGFVQQPENTEKDACLRSTLLSLGYNEAISLAFISQEDASRFSEAEAIKLTNPVSDNLPFLRNSMLPGMLGMLAWNLNHGNFDIFLFESGHVFQVHGESTTESRAMAIGATGHAIAPSVHEPGRPITFFDLKGTVEALLNRFQYRSLYFDSLPAGCFHPGRSARAVLDGTTVARLGQLHHEIAASRKLKQEIYLAEIDLERLYRHPLRQPRFQPVPRYPAVERDFSFVFDQGMTWQRIRSSLEKLRIPELQSLRPLEIFRGGNLGPGEYSLLLRATFQSSERTLRDEELAVWSAQVVQALESLGGRLRAP